MNKLLILILILFLPLTAFSQDSIKTKKTFFRGLVNTVQKVVNSFSDVDTNYIEPQHYNYAAMIQSTNTYERYTLISKSGQSIVLAPNIRNKIGPFFGWRWIFFGYTFDIKNIFFSGGNQPKKEFDFSLYSAIIGVDLHYRRTGNNYKIRSINLGPDVDANGMVGEDFGGLNVGITGINAYYILNHKKFSYPAAFSQSTCQKRSCGSFFLGASYLHHSLSLEHNGLDSLIKERCVPSTAKLDTGLQFSSVKYTNISLSLGYAYSWVFAKNWLLCVSVAPALSYKFSKGKLEDAQIDDQDKGFSFNNINIDAVGRFSVVWNNTKWYAGSSAIIHAFNYKKSQFSTNDVFGSLNIYFGLNFVLRNEYRKTKKG